MNKELLNLTFKQAQADEQWVFALVPSSMLSELQDKINQLKPNAEHLAVGKPGENTVSTVPWLIQLAAAHPFTDWLIDESLTQGKSESIVYGATKVKFAPLKQHLRTLTNVQFPDSTISPFRYYDPRIITAILNSADHIQWQQLFGPIDSFLISKQRFNSLMPIMDTEHYKPTAEPSSPPIVLRQDQIDQISDSQWEDFIQGQIKQYQSYDKLSAKELDEKVREGLAKAQSLGLTTRNNLRRFILLWIAGLDERLMILRPEFQAPFDDNRLEEWEKMDKLEALYA